MTSTHKNSKVMRLVVVAALAVVMGLLFAAPSGAISTDDGCYPDCTTTTEQVTTTTAVEDTTTTAVEVTTTTEEETTTSGGVASSHEDNGGGSLPVTGGDVIALALLGMGIVLIGSTLLAASKRTAPTV